MTRSRAGARLPGLAILLLVLGLAACGGPTSNVDAGQALLDLGDAVNQLRSDNAVLQAQIDSLRQVVARQDTIIARLANATGVPLPPPLP
jgi:hypothetical protein